MLDVLPLSPVREWAISRSFMVRAGLGVAILPASAREVRAEPSLRSRPIDEPGFERPVLVIKKAARTLPPMSESFLAQLKDALKV